MRGTSRTGCLKRVDVWGFGCWVGVCGLWFGFWDFGFFGFWVLGFWVLGFRLEKIYFRDFA